MLLCWDGLLQSADLMLVLQCSFDLESTKAVLQSARSATMEVIYSFSQSKEHCSFLGKANPCLLEQCPRNCVVFFAEAR